MSSMSELYKNLIQNKQSNAPESSLLSTGYKHRQPAEVYVPTNPYERFLSESFKQPPKVPESSLPSTGYRQLPSTVPESSSSFPEYRQKPIIADDRGQLEKKRKELEEERKDELLQKQGWNLIERNRDKPIAEPFKITPDMVNTTIFITTDQIISLKIRPETMRSDLPQYSNYIFGPDFLWDGRWMLTITEYPGNKIRDDMLNRVMKMTQSQVLSYLIQPKEYRMEHSHELISKKYPGYIFIYHSYNDGIYDIEIRKDVKHKESQSGYSQRPSKPMSMSELYRQFNPVSYEAKYLKYKNKFLNLRKQIEEFNIINEER